MGAVRVRVAGRGAATRADVSRLSDLDAAFLHADTPTQHLHVLATLVLDTSAAPAGSVGYRTFQQRMRERVPLVEPMRRRPVEVPGGPTLWAEDSLDQLDRHLHHVVDDGGGIGALAARVGDVASVALPKDRPLWEVWFVEDLGDDRVGVIAKIHHAAVDGVSGIWSLAAFFDLEPSPPPTNTEPWVATPPPSVGDMGRAMFDQVRVSPVDLARRLGRVILESMFPMGPLMEGVGLGVTAVSYRDEVGFGFLACPDLVPDVSRIAAGVEVELERLQSAAASELA